MLLGGKTGLCSVVMSALFVLAWLVYPVLLSVPIFASSAVLIVLGVTLTGLLR